MRAFTRIEWHCFWPDKARAGGISQQARKRIEQGFWRGSTIGDLGKLTVIGRKTVSDYIFFAAYNLVSLGSQRSDDHSDGGKAIRARE